MDSYYLIRIISFYIIAIFVSIKGSVFVRSPGELIKLLNNNPELESDLLDFGNISYGYTTYGKLYNPIKNDKLEFNSCYDFQSKKFINKTADIDESPIFLLDKNSTCSLIDMTYYSEMNGAHIVLFLNNTNSIYVDKILTSKRQINIPSLIINDYSGKIVNKYLTDNPSTEVILEIDFHSVGVR